MPMISRSHSKRLTKRHLCSFGKFNTDELNSEKPAVFMNIADILYVGSCTESQLVFVDAAVFTDFQSVPEPKE